MSLLACGDDESSGGDRVTKAIGPEGGELTSADGKLTIIVPPGALEEVVTLSCETSDEQAQGAVGSVYELGPTGQAFLEGVELRFTPPTSHPPSALQPVTFSASGYEALEAVRRTTTTVSGATMHFSRFGLVPVVADDAGIIGFDDAGIDAATVNDGGSFEDAGSEEDAGDPGNTSDAGSETGGLAAWYRFEESSGAVLDSSGNGNDGVVVGTGTTQGATGRVGNAITFAGSSHIEIPSSTSMDFTTGATIEVWVKVPESQLSGVGSIVSRGTGNSDNMVAMHTAAVPDIQVSFSKATEPGSGLNGVNTQGEVLAADTWTHFALVNDGTNVTVYVNGVVNATSAGGGYLTAIENDVYIGLREPNVFQLSGSVDELKWWTVVRTAEQICEDAGGQVEQDGCVLD